LAVKRVYWDSCAWLGLINGEADKLAACQYILDEAVAERVEIWTSALSLAEVFKVKCSGKASSLPADKDQAFEDFLLKEFVVRAAVTVEIATFTRTLLRKFGGSPNDTIHLATAAIYNADELHTYDDKLLALDADELHTYDDKLLALDRKVKRADGEMLTIVRPPDPPPGTKIPLLEAKASDATSQAQS